MPAAMLGRDAGTSTPEDRRAAPRGRVPDRSARGFARRSANRLARWSVPGVPALTALIVTCWNLGTPSFWRDEAVTIDVAQRSLSDTIRLLSHIDAVHGAYYLLMHPVAATLGIGETAMRLPSAAAAALAAAMTAVLGRRLATPGVGLAAGLLVAGAPTISRYAQEARQYTLVTALAVTATYLLVRVVETGGRRGTLPAYGLSLVLLAAGHLMALLLLAAHAVALCTVRPGRVLVRRWSLTVAAALLAVVPLAVVALPQRGQVDWIPRPAPHDVTDLLGFLSGSARLTVPVVSLVVLCLLPRRRRRSGQAEPGEASGDAGMEDAAASDAAASDDAAPDATAPDAAARAVGLHGLALAWALLPPALLLGISLIKPLYLPRYVLYSLPAVALLAAAGLARLRWWAALPVGVAMAVLAVPAHQEIRLPAARADDLRLMAATIRAGARPGDTIVFHHTLYRRVMAAYPRTYAPLRDVALQSDPAAAGNLMGVEVSPAVLAERLRGVDRVWFVDNRVGFRLPDDPADAAKARLIRTSRDFCKISQWRYRGGSIFLYGRCR